MDTSTKLSILKAVKKRAKRNYREAREERTHSKEQAVLNELERELDKE